MKEREREREKDIDRACIWLQCFVNVLSVLCASLDYNVFHHWLTKEHSIKQHPVLLCLLSVNHKQQKMLQFILSNSSENSSCQF